VLFRSVDVVLIKLFYQVDGVRKYVIQVGETASGKEKRNVNQLPGMLKEGHENFFQVAKRVVFEQLEMSSCQCVFEKSTENYEDQVESPSYPGLRTVYRKTIFECEITVKDPTVLAQVGATSGKEYTVTDALKITRVLKWMTDRQAIDLKVKLTIPLTADVSSLAGVPVGFNKEQLAAFLSNAKIDITKFGTANYGSLDDFAEELMRGEAALEKQPDGSILRVVDIILLRLEMRTGGAILVEATETARDTKESKKLERLPTVKRRDNENVFSAAQRLMAKVMKIDIDTVTLDHQNVVVVEQFQQADAYPDIKTKCRKRTVTGYYEGIGFGLSSTPARETI